MASAEGATDYWLPPHQEHALYTSAHIDATIHELLDILHNYLRNDPLQVTSRFTSSTEAVVLDGVTPLPQAVQRLFADALNQARNMLEHALHAEIRYRLGRPLTDDESKAIEVPVFDAPQDFARWRQHKHRLSLSPLLDAEGDIIGRLDRIQPFHRKDCDAHPLRVLAAHTNYAKHREPTVALTRVGRVDLDTVPSGSSADHQEILEVGTVLAAVPRGTKVGVSIWPQVVVQRPHTGEWRTLLHELREIEDWVRRIALPIIVVGRTDVTPIPPHLDIRVGYQRPQQAWKAAEPTAAAERATARMVAEGLRRDILEMLVDFDGEEARDAYTKWLYSQDDTRVRDMFAPISVAALKGDEADATRTLLQWRGEAGLSNPV